jgi:hypothetical protein
VRTGRLLGLGLGQDAAVLSASRRSAGTPTRRDVGLDRHRDSNSCPCWHAVTDLLTSRELDAALVLETLAAEPCAT